MHPNQVAQIVGRLDAILRELKLAELRRMMDGDFNRMGSLSEATRELIRNSGLAHEFGGLPISKERWDYD